MALGVGVGLPFFLTTLGRTDAWPSIDWTQLLSNPALVSGYDMAGLSTYVDADGVVRYQPHNLLLRSRDASTSAPWTTWGEVLVSGPPGDQLLTVNIATGNPVRWQNRTLGDGRPLSLVVVVSGGTASYVDIGLYSGASGWVAVGTQIMSGPGTLDSFNIGRARVSNLQPGVKTYVRVTLSSAPLAEYGTAIYPETGTVGKTVGFHGAYLMFGVPASIAELIDNDSTSTARHLPALFDGGRRGLRLEGPQTQLAPKSEDPNDSAWLKYRVSVVLNAATAPNGASTAEAIVENTDTNTHELGLGTSLAANTQVTVRQRVRRGVGARNLRLTLYAGSDGLRVRFDLGSGTFLNESYGAAVFASASITGPDARGYYTVTMTGIPSPTAGAPILSWQMLTASNVSFYAGDGASSLIFGDFQLETGALASSYIPNPTTGSVLRPGAQQIITGAEFSRLFPAARLGAELVVNGGFAADLTPWTQTGNGGSFAWDAGRATVAAADNRLLRQDGILVADKRYSWTYTLPVAVTGGYADLLIGGRTTTGQAQAGTYSGFTTPLSNNNVMFQAFGNVTVDNISVRELDTSVPSLQAFTLFITLADRPRMFVPPNTVAFFAMNNGSGYSGGSGLLIRESGYGAAQAGGNNSAVNNGAFVDGRNVVAMTVDVANKRLALSLNGALPSVLTTLDYTGVGTTRAQLRGIDPFASQGDGVVMHQSLEVLPLMSDAALQAECARRFALT